MGEAARRWAALQGGRGIPPEILAAARADPWTHEPRDFTAPQVAVDTPSRHAATLLLAEHPVAWRDPLWRRFHGLQRPASATAYDAVAVLGELGIHSEVVRWDRATAPRSDAAWVARRLCLPPERTDDVAVALAELPTRPRQAATLTWRP